MRYVIQYFFVNCPFIHTKYHHLSLLVLFILNCYINIVTHTAQSFVWCAGKIFWYLNPCIFTWYVTLSPFRWLDSELSYTEHYHNRTRIQKRQIFSLWISKLRLRCETFWASFIILTQRRTESSYVCSVSSIFLGVTSLFYGVVVFLILDVRVFLRCFLSLGLGAHLNFWSSPLAHMWVLDLFIATLCQ